MSSPFLPSRFESPAIKDGVSCLWCQKTDSQQADSHRSVLEQYATGVFTQLGYTYSYSARQRKGQEKARVADNSWREGEGEREIETVDRIVKIAREAEVERPRFV